MTDTPRLWDRRADETPKSYAAFVAYCDLGAQRSVRLAARQNHVKTGSPGAEDTTVKHWLHWSAKHKWVSRSRMSRSSSTNWRAIWLWSRGRMTSSRQPTAMYSCVEQERSRCNTRRFSAWRMSRSGLRIYRTCRTLTWIA